jgi:hypothetical protein
MRCAMASVLAQIRIVCAGYCSSPGTSARRRHGDSTAPRDNVGCRGVGVDKAGSALQKCGEESWKAD